MISKRLIKAVPEAKNHIITNVYYQMISLVNNIVIMWALGRMLEGVYTASLSTQQITVNTIIIAVAILVRFACAMLASRASHHAAKSVKFILREKIYNKMLRIGNGYTKKISTAEVVQVTVEGVDQLETYFGSYLPQFFYAMLGPIVLFVAVATMSLKIAVILFLCVPMIPISIIAVQKFAKKLLAKYWGEYTGLGDNFLENLQGLNTLKIYSADEHKHQEMNVQAERFRKITMRVLTMQLNSISVMDIIAYGGTALGIGFSIIEFGDGNITLSQAFVIILLCADFFLPMRLLGSFFHIAMNGMAASKKIFTLLDMEEDEEGTGEITDNSIIIKDLNFAYEEDKEILHNINLNIPCQGVYSLVGESGCGKSTIAGLLAGNLTSYTGSISYGEQELNEVSHANILNAVTVVGLGSYIFKGTLRDNLLMGNKEATDEQLWEALDSVNLKEYMQSQQGLDTFIKEKGSNLSGGQCQRLALSRALLHNTSVYIFDEATSNIDVESENEIMEVIEKLGQVKTVLLISHRLANVVNSREIFVLEKGELKESGTHQQLIENEGVYNELWNTQSALENICGGGQNE